MRLFVTGAVGFIGFHVAQRLLQRGDTVVGLDSLNDYYDPKLKLMRLSLISGHPNFSFQKVDIADQATVAQLFEQEMPEAVVHLAAQAGVRYSLTNPMAYVDANLVGFMNVLEGCRSGKVQHLVYASSSSVYGLNRKQPFSEHDNVDHPVSLYAATKKANELLAHSYSHLFNIPTSGLRFFTVYGPWGRPDMAYFIFAKAILEATPINLFNYGRARRDFTYIDDVVDAIVRVLDCPPVENPCWSGFDLDPAMSSAPYRVFNVGNNQPVELVRFVDVLESSLGRRTERNLLPPQPGDVVETYADIDALRKAVDFRPTTTIEEGLSKFAEWYLWYSNTSNAIAETNNNISEHEEIG